MKNTAFARNFTALFNATGKTQDEVASALGVDRITIYNWRNGRISKPKSQEVVDRLKEYFGVEEQDLFGYNDGFYAKAYGLADGPSGAIAATQPRKATAPLLGRVHAGDASEPDVLDEAVSLPYEVWERHPRGYFLEVEGTCMSRVYPEGCYVYVDPEKQPQNGSVAVVSIDGADYVMRRMYRGSSSLLLVADSYDGGWDDIVVSGDDHEVGIVGTVVWFQPREELP